MTNRELEVLSLIAAGYQDQDIVNELKITRSTVRQHLNSICRKLGASNRAHAVALAYETGLLVPEKS